MRNLVFILFVLFLFSCSEDKKDDKKSLPFTSVTIETIYEDSVSIRAIELMDNSLAYAGSDGVFGNIDLLTGKIREGTQQYDSITPEFRAVAHTNSDFFMLSVSNPALLYKTGMEGKMELVYTETGEGVFYDAMTFWNDQEGIAMGDSMNGCLSIIVTRNGGNSWNKLSCSELPDGIEGEGAFAASNTNIAVIGDKTWIATTSGRVYFSPDKGKSWEIQQTPIVGEEPTQGIYSIAFYDEDLGVAIGGDYTRPEENRANKAITEDGGINWRLIVDGQNPPYKSCIQFVPNSEGNGMVALGFTGISYSSDRGASWQQLSETDSFYTIRFLNDSIAYAAGKNRMAKLAFR
ncbi:oxidoreductase [Pricia sp. S334]|uniref:Oxidoreductase n=1 Tax=Pricia mediterranea TaxID=3076079 RepID=A0ABU3L9S9_9FLAO|nr:oxidoreductase [Pricia sp. S334]MDT7830252.1 oxidoreductase [Pricia sp. S334]